MDQTVIVIPCYNEADRLDGDAFIGFLNQQPHIKFLFVNDGSTDHTGKMIEDLTQRSPRALTLHLKKNSGKAEAVRQGFLKAFALGPVAIGFIDADLAAPLSCIPELESLLANNNAEIAMGARVALLGRHIERKEARHYIGRVFATAASMILGLRVYDTQCGAKLFRATDRLKRVFATPFFVTWIFDVEILARFIITEHEGLPRVCDICIEHPLHEWVDKKGSKLRLKDFLVSTLDLVKIALLMRRKSLPSP